MLFKRKNRINADDIQAMSVSADIISTNSEFGHYNVGEFTGKTFELKTDNYILKFIGGILVDVKENKE